jgi:F-type H+-transporting ATPase subunit a
VFIVPVADVAWKLFDMFIGFIQAFIFALLTIVYYGMATTVEADH